jgi:hypothetical protein
VRSLDSGRDCLAWPVFHECVNIELEEVSVQFLKIASTSDLIRLAIVPAPLPYDVVNHVVFRQYGNMIPQPTAPVVDIQFTQYHAAASSESSSGSISRCCNDSYSASNYGKWHRRRYSTNYAPDAPSRSLSYHPFAIQRCESLNHIQ